MIASKEKEGIYLASFMELEGRLAASGPSWLHEIRRAAMAGFAEKGFPTTRQEEWRNTNVAPIAAVPFQPATTPRPPPQGGGELDPSLTRTQGRAGELDPSLRELGPSLVRRGEGVVADISLPTLAERIGQHPLADLGCPRLVFINGRFSKQLSTLEALPKGMKAGSLAEALASDGKTLERHLTCYAADYREHAFVALNTAFL